MSGRGCEQFCFCPKTDKSRPGDVLANKRARSTSLREAAGKKRRTCAESTADIQPSGP